MDFVLILGNQLFEPKYLQKCLGKKTAKVFMREDAELCTYFRFHKHKLVFFLGAMRAYREELARHGFSVQYQKLDAVPGTYEQALLDELAKSRVRKIFCFEIEDKFFEARIFRTLQAAGVEVEVWPSPMFLTTRSQFQSYLRGQRRPFMKTFYEGQRRRLNILMDGERKPIGGKWSFDGENRLALPPTEQPPEPPRVQKQEGVEELLGFVEARFSAHPGSSQNYWLPVSREGARKWLRIFVEERLKKFGPYEDALANHSDFVYHSALTPFLNSGLLTPEEVVQGVLATAKKNEIPLASLEGFIRQVIGWREFIRGIYQNFSDAEETTNFFQHDRLLTNHWYRGDTGVAPLDNVIHKVLRLAYSHHIERLMVVGSLMTLLEIAPREAHRWFMEMYVDSSDWVMGPNVYGMALFADGGIFATKPYICGSNYYRKMGPYRLSESWCDAVDGLYWSFIEKHADFFFKNPRLSMIVRTMQKMNAEKKARIYRAAADLREKITQPAGHIPG